MLIALTSRLPTHARLNICKYREFRVLLLISGHLHLQPRLASPNLPRGPAKWSKERASGKVFEIILVRKPEISLFFLEKKLLKEIVRGLFLP